MFPANPVPPLAVPSSTPALLGSPISLPSTQHWEQREPQGWAVLTTGPAALGAQHVCLAAM